MKGTKMAGHSKRFAGLRISLCEHDLATRQPRHAQQRMAPSEPRRKPGAHRSSGLAHGPRATAARALTSSHPRRYHLTDINRVTRSVPHQPGPAIDDPAGHVSCASIEAASNDLPVKRASGVADQLVALDHSPSRLLRHLQDTSSDSIGSFRQDALLHRPPFKQHPIHREVLARATTDSSDAGHW